MVISDRVRLLFVHVQKTGGSTIQNRLEEVLDDTRHVPGIDRHATLGQILRKEPGLSSYWTFGVVRNPWARMLSWYNMVDRFRETKAGGEARIERKNHFMQSVAETCPDFETFVMKGLDEFNRLQVPQWRYISTRTRRADFIGRQESLEADLRAVHARFDIPWTPLQSVNIDRSRPDYKTDDFQLGGDDTRYREFYDDAMRRRVEAVFAKDVTSFGYEF